MINTNMARKIVTNLRIEEDSWLQLKSEAGELGMSVNEYINFLLRDLSNRRLFNPKKRDALFWRLGELSKMKSEPLGELSEDDKIIYGID